MEYILQQVLLLNPLLFPFWLGGLAWLVFACRGRFRIMGWMYLFTLGALILLKGKHYYLSPICPMLFAAGGVAAEEGLDRWRRTRNRGWPKAFLLAWVSISLLVVAPAVLPVLSPPSLLAYQAMVGFNPPRMETSPQGPLEQRLGDQFGWPEMVAEVSRIYHGLAPGERQRTVILARNYGEAGAVNQFGPALGLPVAYCPQQACFLWGPPAEEPGTVICLGYDRANLEKQFVSVERAVEHFHPWGMASENRPIFLCRGLRKPVHEIWPLIKDWS